MRFSTTGNESMLKKKTFYCVEEELSAREFIDSHFPIYETMKASTIEF